MMSPLRFFVGFESPVEPSIAGCNNEDVPFYSILFTAANEEEVIAEDRDSTSEFDAVIGAIEEIVVEDRFQELQHNLLEKYHHHFEVLNVLY